MNKKRDRQRGNADGRKEPSDMNSTNKYTRKTKERKAFAIIMALIFLALVTIGILEICGVFDESPWQPVMEYPIANANVSWDQTFHAGGWSGDQ